MKEINSGDFKDALLLATNHDALEEFAPAYVAPFWQDHKLVATDGQLMMAVDEGLALEYVSKATYKYLDKPNVDALLCTLNDDSEYDLRRDVLEKGIEAVPLKDYGECEECHGKGEVRVEYTAKNGEEYNLPADCPICSGTGRVYLHPDQKVPVDNFPVLIDGQYFRSDIIYKILRIMQLLDIERMSYHTDEDRDEKDYSKAGFRYGTDDGYYIYIAAVPNGIYEGKAFWPYDKSLRKGDAVRIKLTCVDNDPEMPW